MVFIGMSDIDPEQLKRYAQGKCSPLERLIVEQWLDAEQDVQSDSTEGDPLVKAAIWKGLMEKEASSTKGKPGNRLWYMSAAAIFLIGGLLFLKTSTLPKGDSSISMVRYTAPMGRIVSLQLPDHSTVTLSGGSTVKYPKVFSTQNRVVEFISGEGFFAIRHNPSCPFLVRTLETEVRVLGTRFNVNITGNGNVEVSLTQGAVSFTGKDQLKTILKPGQQLSYDLLHHKLNGVAAIDTAYITSWSKDILCFRQTPMTEVLERLEKHYGVKFFVQGNPDLRVPMTARFRHQPLSKIIELIHNSTSLSFKQENNRITIY